MRIEWRGFRRRQVFQRRQFLERSGGLRICLTLSKSPCHASASNLADKAHRNTGFSERRIYCYRWGASISYNMKRKKYNKWQEIGKWTTFTHCSHGSVSKVTGSFGKLKVWETANWGSRSFGTSTRNRFSAKFQKLLQKNTSAERVILTNREPRSSGERKDETLRKTAFTKPETPSIAPWLNDINISFNNNRITMDDCASRRSTQWLSY